MLGWHNDALLYSFLRTLVCFVHVVCSLCCFQRVTCVLKLRGVRACWATRLRTPLLRPEQYTDGASAVWAHLLADCAKTLTSSHPYAFEDLSPRLTKGPTWLSQVIAALNKGQLAPPAMPYALLQALLRSPCIIQELRSSIAGSAPPSPEQRDGSGPCWSADVDVLTVPPAVKLVQVGGAGDAVERIGQLLGACLQTILST
jgi:hypothetical protein